MINLMPDAEKMEIRAGKVNVVLVRYIIIIVLAFSFLVLLLIGSYLLLRQNKASAQQVIDANAAKAQVYSSTKQQVDALSTSLTQAKTILDKEILYSKVLTNIGQQMPAGTVIDKLTLSSASFTGTPTTIRAYAKTSADVVALREKFQSSPYFTNVSFDSISDTSGGIKDYPVSVSMTLTFTKAVTQ